LFRTCAQNSFIIPIIIKKKRYCAIKKFLTSSCPCANAAKNLADYIKFLLAGIFLSVLPATNNQYLGGSAFGGKTYDAVFPLKTRLRQKLETFGEQTFPFL
jgi:hypothetical protein